MNFVNSENYTNHILGFSLGLKIYYMKTVCCKAMQIYMTLDIKQIMASMGYYDLYLHFRKISTVAFVR